MELLSICWSFVWWIWIGSFLSLPLLLIGESVGGGGYGTGSWVHNGWLARGIGKVDIIVDIILGS